MEAKKHVFTTPRAKTGGLVDWHLHLALSLSRSRFYTQLTLPAHLERAWVEKLGMASRELEVTVIDLTVSSESEPEESDTESVDSDVEEGTCTRCACLMHVLIVF